MNTSLSSTRIFTTTTSTSTTAIMPSEYKSDSKEYYIATDSETYSINESIESRWNNSKLNTLHQDIKLLGLLLNTMNWMCEKLSKAIDNPKKTIAYKAIIRLVKGESLENICKNKADIVDTLIHSCTPKNNDNLILIKTEYGTILAPHILKELQFICQFSDVYQNQDCIKVNELLKKIDYAGEYDSQYQIIPINILNFYYDHPDFPGFAEKLGNKNFIIDAENSEIEFNEFKSSYVKNFTFKNAAVDLNQNSISVLHFKDAMNNGCEIRNATIKGVSLEEYKEFGYSSDSDFDSVSDPDFDSDSVSDSDSYDLDSIIKLTWHEIKKAMLYNCTFQESGDIKVNTRSIIDELVQQLMCNYDCHVLFNEREQTAFTNLPVKLKGEMITKFAELTINSMLEEIRVGFFASFYDNILKDYDKLIDNTPQLRTLFEQKMRASHLHVLFNEGEQSPFTNLPKELKGVIITKFAKLAMKSIIQKLYNDNFVHKYYTISESFANALEIFNTLFQKIQ